MRRAAAIVVMLVAHSAAGQESAPHVVTKATVVRPAPASGPAAGQVLKGTTVDVIARSLAAIDTCIQGCLHRVVQFGIFYELLMGRPWDDTSAQTLIQVQAVVVAILSAILIVATSLAASLIPAARAMRTDPITVMRSV